MQSDTHPKTHLRYTRATTGSLGVLYGIIGTERCFSEASFGFGLALTLKAPIEFEHVRELWVPEDTCLQYRIHVYSIKPARTLV